MSTMSMQLFNNGEFELQLIPDGDSFIVAAPGLARALGHRHANHMLANVPPEEKGYRLDGTPGGKQQIGYVTEPGLYRVLGQRQLGRIKNDETRNKVERFQNWIFREVLPAIRCAGRYERAVDEPITYTWDEVTAVIRQRYGLTIPVATLTRRLRTAGILRQNGVPRTAHRHFFWFTGSAWEIHPHGIPFLLRKAEDVTRELAQFRFIAEQYEMPYMPERTTLV